MRQPYVQDSSSNGTWLNGTRLSYGAMLNLHEGDRIELVADENGKESSIVFRFLTSGLCSDIRRCTTANVRGVILGSGFFFTARLLMDSLHTPALRKGYVATEARSEM